MIYPTAVARSVLALALALCALQSSAQGNPNPATVDSTLWGVEPGGRVFCVQRSGSTIYVGGNFAKVGPNSGGGVPLDIASERPVLDFPKVAGRVNVVVADGAGGWYIGGNFSAVGGLKRKNLAHLSPGGVDAAWSADANAQVLALALTDSALYVGGAFDSLGGVPRVCVGAVRRDDGSTTSWNPGTTVGGRVHALLVRDTTVYVGGLFTTAAGQPRRNIAAVSTLDGRATSWNPGATARVLSFACHDTTLFVGGHFSNFAGTARRCLAAIDMRSGGLLPWNADVTRVPDFIYDGGPRVASLIVRDSVLYVAGSFKTIGGSYREGLAAVNIHTALATAWDPRSYSQISFGAYFSALALSGDTLFVAGQMDSLGGRLGSYLAAVSTESGSRLTWDPRPNWEVFSLAISDGTLFAAGGFTSMGDWVRRRNLAAFDAGTGALKPWDPQADYPVNCLMVVGDAVYVGGVFGSVGGQSRVGIAMLDGETGEALAWNPNANGAVDALALWGNTVLMGGWFTSIGGQPRNRLAAIDIATGLATAWDPNASDGVSAVVATDSVIYVGGEFSGMGGLPRQTLAAIDPWTGLPTPWAPTTDWYVQSIAVLNGTIFVGGGFNFVNGIQRDAFAAITPSGELTSWSANADGRVYALTAADSTVYVGGPFRSIGGQSRPGVAALDASTGAIKDWNPSADGIVWGLSADDEHVYAVGSYGNMGDWPKSGIAAITLADARIPLLSPRLMLAQNAPNPVAHSTSIRYSLPRAAPVRLSVYDLQGRRVQKVIDGEVQDSGFHQVVIATSGLAAGCYVYRLEASRVERIKEDGGNSIDGAFENLRGQCGQCLGGGMGKAALIGSRVCCVLVLSFSSAHALPAGRAWTEPAPLRPSASSGYDRLAAPVLESDSSGTLLLRAAALGVGTHGVLGFRWSDSSWVRAWEYGNPTAWIPPVSTLDRSEHLVWTAQTDNPWMQGRLFFGSVAGQQLAPVDTVALLVRFALQYSAAVTRTTRAAIVSDNFRLRLFQSGLVGPWSELPVNGDGSAGVAAAASDDSTVVIVWTQGLRMYWGTLTNGNWAPGADAILGGLPWTPTFRRRPSGGQWLAWATNDSGVGLAHFERGKWTILPWLSPTYHGATSGGIQFLTVWVDLSRDRGEYPAVVFYVDGLFGETTLFVSVPTDSGFGVPEVLTAPPNNQLATIGRDVDGDVWVAWWDRVPGGTAWWTHTYTSVEARALQVVRTGSVRTLTWQLTAPAPGSRWTVLRAINDGPFEVAARVQAGPGLGVSWQDDASRGVVRYRLRRECIDSRFRWESNEIRWPTGNRRPQLVALSAQPTSGGAAAFAITDASAGTGHLDVFDLQGRRVSRQAFESIGERVIARLSVLKGAAAGVYFARATDARGIVSATSRIVVLR